MLWGGISWRRRVQRAIFQNNGVGCGRGVTARHYVDGVLQPVLMPFMAGRRGMVFQQDNARTHSARLTQDFLYRDNILQWTGQI